MAGMTRIPSMDAGGTAEVGASAVDAALSRGFEAIATRLAALGDGGVSGGSYTRTRAGDADAGSEARVAARTDGMAASAGGDTPAQTPGVRAKLDGALPEGVPAGGEVTVRIQVAGESPALLKVAAREGVDVLADGMGGVVVLRGQAAAVREVLADMALQSTEDSGDGSGTSGPLTLQFEMVHPQLALRSDVVVDSFGGDVLSTAVRATSHGASFYTQPDTTGGGAREDDDADLLGDDGQNGSRAGASLLDETATAPGGLLDEDGDGGSPSTPQSRSPRSRTGDENRNDLLTGDGDANASRPQPQPQPDTGRPTAGQPQPDDSHTPTPTPTPQPDTEADPTPPASPPPPAPASVVINGVMGGGFSEDAGAATLPLMSLNLTNTGSQNVTLRLTLGDATSGALNVGTSSGLQGAAVTATWNGATGVWEAMGHVAEVNELLASLAFTPAGDWDQDVSVSLQATSGTTTKAASLVMTATAADDAPVADDATVSLSEDAANGAAVATATASDVDTGDTASWAITAGNDDGVFTIDAGTGAITVADNSSLNYEATTSYALTVEVTDAGGLTDTSTITVNVGDINEAPSAISDTNGAANSIDEDVSNGTLVGITASATDVDAGDAITFSLSDDAGGRFAIDANTGVVSVADASQINYEDATSHGITVVATDSGGLTSQANYTITIGNVNDTPTAITPASFSVDENSALGTVVATLGTTDEDVADTHTYTLVADPDGKFTLDGNQLKVNGLLNHEIKSSHSVTLRTDDGNGASPGKLARNARPHHFHAAELGFFAEQLAHDIFHVRLVRRLAEEGRPLEFLQKLGKLRMRLADNRLAQSLDRLKRRGAVVFQERNRAFADVGLSGRGPIGQRIGDHSLLRLCLQERAPFLELRIFRQAFGCFELRLQVCVSSARSGSILPISFIECPDLRGFPVRDFPLLKC